MKMTDDTSDVAPGRLFKSMPNKKPRRRSLSQKIARAVRVLDEIADTMDEITYTSLSKINFGELNIKPPRIMRRKRSKYGIGAGSASEQGRAAKIEPLYDKYGTPTLTRRRRTQDERFKKHGHAVPIRLGVPGVYLHNRPERLLLKIGSPLLCVLPSGYVVGTNPMLLSADDFTRAGIDVPFWFRSRSADTPDDTPRPEIRIQPDYTQITCVDAIRSHCANCAMTGTSELKRLETIEMRVKQCKYAECPLFVKRAPIENWISPLMPEEYLHISHRMRIKQLPVDAVADYCRRCVNRGMDVRDLDTSVAVSYCRAVRCPIWAYRPFDTNAVEEWTKHEMHIEPMWRRPPPGWQVIPTTPFVRAVNELSAKFDSSSHAKDVYVEVITAAKIARDGYLAAPKGSGREAELQAVVDALNNFGAQSIPDVNSAVVVKCLSCKDNSRAVNACTTTFCPLWQHRDGGADRSTMALDLADQPVSARHVQVAVESYCRACCGGIIERVAQCEVITCPLWIHRLFVRRVNTGGIKNYNDKTFPKIAGLAELAGKERVEKAEMIIRNAATDTKAALKLCETVALTTKFMNDFRRDAPETRGRIKRTIESRKLLFAMAGAATAILESGDANVDLRVLSSRILKLTKDARL